MAAPRGHRGRRVLHIATFKGRHNQTKSKTLIVLYHRLHTLSNRTGLGLRELSLLTGCDYAYLKSRLGKWVGWGYLNRTYATGPGGRPIFVYSIADRGKRFIEERLPPSRRAEYIQEIKQSRRN